MPADLFPDPAHLNALDNALRLKGFFAGMGAAKAKSFLPSLSFRAFSDGERILVEGAESKEILVLLQGSAFVCKTRREALHPVAKLSPGDSFGEIGVLAGIRRSATVASDGDCVAASFSRQDLDKLVERNPELGEWLERQARRRMSELADGPPETFGFPDKK